jgi:hypothetical protein
LTVIFPCAGGTTRRITGNRPANAIRAHAVENANVCVGVEAALELSARSFALGQMRANAPKTRLMAMTAISYEVSEIINM